MPQTSAIFAAAASTASTTPQARALLSAFFFSGRLSVIVRTCPASAIFTTSDIFVLLPIVWPHHATNRRRWKQRHGVQENGRTAYDKRLSAIAFCMTMNGDGAF